MTVCDGSFLCLSLDRSLTTSTTPKSLFKMAIDVYTILTLPASRAFSSYSSTGAGVVEQPRSDSPARKIPRLTKDSDSASASRSRQLRDDGTRASESKGSIVLSLQGPPGLYLSTFK